ncbi:VanZ family protein [Winogradskyella sediminis]|uniref:VanZ like family protein n=1 Tax=Winogradskyella sediminis TaxID=1382466 RepID=A0A1H1TLR9_9FLAO|nr:VanZ family protein [Winogradskyella sediminis]SDS61011.1 VanZ like family protein [Winogradskyella sediminis]
MLLLLSVIYTLTLVIASLITLQGVPSMGTSFDDKIFHVVAYLGLTLLWVLYANPKKKSRLHYGICFAAIFFGFILELLQYLLNPNRTYDTYDLIANSIGAIFGTLIASKINIYKLN